MDHVLPKYFTILDNVNDAMILNFRFIFVVVIKTLTEVHTSENLLKDMSEKISKSLFIKYIILHHLAMKIGIRRTNAWHMQQLIYLSHLRTVSPSYIRIFNASYQPLSDNDSLNVTQDSAVTFVCMSTRSRPSNFSKMADW